MCNAKLPEQLDHDRMDRVHHRRVERMLRLQTAPDELVNGESHEMFRVFARHAERADYSV